MSETSFENINLEEIPLTPMPEPEAQPAPEAPASAMDPEPVLELGDDPFGNQKSKAPLRKRLSLGVRIPMQFLSFFLSMALIVCLVLTVLVMDVRALVSSGGVKTIITTVMNSQTVSEPSAATPNPYYNQMAAATELPPNLELPSDLTDMDALVDWIGQVSKEMLGEEANVTEEQVKNFLSDSTMTDFLSEKVADLADDMINGTENTAITAEEIVKLVEDNKDAVWKHFGVEITDNHLKQVEQTAQQIVTEQKINEKLHEAVKEIRESEEPIIGDLTMQDLLNTLAAITSELVIFALVLACLILAALICLVNFYNVPAGLSWSGISAMCIGLLMSLPVAVLQLTGALESIFYGDTAAILPVAQSLLKVMAPLHYGLAILGFVLLMVSVVWRIIRGRLQKQPQMA